MARPGTFPRIDKNGNTHLSIVVPQITLSGTTAQQVGETDMCAGAHGINVVVKQDNVASGGNLLVRAQGGVWKNGASGESDKVWNTISSTLLTHTIGTEAVLQIDEDVYGRMEWFRLDVVQTGGTTGTSTADITITALHKK